MFVVYDEGTGKYLDVKNVTGENKWGSPVYKTYDTPVVGICYTEWEAAAKAGELAYNSNPIYDEVYIKEV